MMADYVKADEGQCRNCGGMQNLQWAHVLSRRYLAVRWERENSMALCSQCHFFFTNRPAEWESFCRRAGVPWDALRDQALNGRSMNALRVVAALSDEWEITT